MQGLIRTLASYKANTLVWEWEDKLAYERHPEIGSPGAFTIAEMQQLTEYGLGQGQDWDMRYLIVDEELLDLEGYLQRLTICISTYRDNLRR
ncbi:MAG: hypothetical protein O2782_02850 [bacterium]|nr:hypothetical protein [bacterium]